MPVLDPDVGEVLGDLIAAGRVEAISDAVPANAAPLLPAIYDVVRGAFALSLHETFAIGAASCLAGAAIALLIQNPAPRRVQAGNRPPEGTARPAVAD
jgi:hypothetical protein